MAYKRLGDILLAAGLIDAATLNGALAESKATGKRLGETLFDKGLITERQLIDILKIQLGVDDIDLSRTNISPDMASQVPRNLAIKHMVVPVKIAGDKLMLAMADPLDYNAIEAVKAATRKRVVPVITTRAAAERAIATLYGNENVSKAIDEMQSKLGGADSLIRDAAAREQEENAQTAPAIRLVNSVLERAVAENASDIHFEPREEDMVVRMRIDGVLHQILNIPGNLCNAIISRIKIMGEMDIAERRVPQDGRTNLTVQKRSFDVRISTLPTIFGEKIVMRLLEKSGKVLSNEGIGLEGTMLRQYRELIGNANGVILISGPTGSGKSTTMYTMVSELNRDEVNLVTLEDPVEYNIEGVNQVQINEKTGMTFASGLRSILRQDPDIIAVGEIRDGETAGIAMRAAITGHLVLSTIHTNSAIATLDRLEDIGIEPYLVAGALKGVVAQRLVRKICPHCRERYVPTPEDLAEAGFEGGAQGKTFYRGTGCPDCLGTGYRGRTAVFEILILNADVKRKLRERATRAELEDAVKASGFVSMSENCRSLILKGVTTIDEARRMLHTTDG